MGDHLKRPFALVAVGGLMGALLFATPVFAGSGNGDNNDNGDSYKNKFNDVASTRTCDTEGDTQDTVGYAGPSLVWPPNHKLAPASVITATADQASDGSYDNTETVTLNTMVSSDEPDNGLGDGNTDTDSNAPQTNGPNDTGKATTTQQVRAERSGTGDGRTYTIDFTAEFEDANGMKYICTSVAQGAPGDPADDPQNANTTIVRVAPFTVTVPHDMSDPAVRDQRNNGK